MWTAKDLLLTADGDPEEANERRYMQRLPRVRQSDGTLANTPDLQSATALRTAYLKQHLPDLQLVQSGQHDPWQGKYVGEFMGDQYYVYQVLLSDTPGSINHERIDTSIPGRHSLEGS